MKSKKSKKKVVSRDEALAEQLEATRAAVDALRDEVFMAREKCIELDAAMRRASRNYQKLFEKRAQEEVRLRRIEEEMLARKRARRIPLEAAKTVLQCKGIGIADARIAQSLRKSGMAVRHWWQPDKGDRWTIESDADDVSRVFFRVTRERLREARKAKARGRASK